MITRVHMHASALGRQLQVLRQSLNSKSSSGFVPVIRDISLRCVMALYYLIEYLVKKIDACVVEGLNSYSQFCIMFLTSILNMNFDLNRK